ncbi:hypothetical protein [Aliikangiella marina]|uniref:hypothetical protein n=1 Tax=Aliikangiella marina TaxID=1712262 RepID=UPI00163D9266|nr:hypothetical protein [Aliikangiella marina]
MQDFNISTVKSPPYDPEDGGIPPDMVDSIVEDDWASWKTVPSKLSESEVLEFLKYYSKNIPEVLVEYLLSDCHMLDELGLDETTNVFIPHIPSDDPLGPMKQLLEGWKLLLKLEYLPIAEMGPGWGPICIKHDGGVVWFDHEQLIDISESAELKELECLEQSVTKSAAEFYMQIFTE